MYFIYDILSINYIMNMQRTTQVATGIGVAIQGAREQKNHQTKKAGHTEKQPKERKEGINLILTK